MANISDKAATNLINPTNEAVINERSAFYNAALRNFKDDDQNMHADEPDVKIQAVETNEPDAVDEDEPDEDDDEDEPDDADDEDEDDEDADESIKDESDGKIQADDEEHIRSVDIFEYPGVYVRTASVNYLRSNKILFLAEMATIVNHLIKLIEMEGDNARSIFYLYFKKMGIHHDIWDIERNLIEYDPNDRIEISEENKKIYIGNFYKFVNEFACEPNLNRGRYLCIMPKCKWIGTSQETAKKHLLSHFYRNKCEKCGKRFMSPEYLASHVNRQTCGKKYSCEKCGKTYARRSSCTIHIKNNCKD